MTQTFILIKIQAAEAEAFLLLLLLTLSKVQSWIFSTLDLKVVTRQADTII